jgi:hypothetical protein
MERQTEIEFKIIPEPWQICAMCHCAGECSECPEKCRKQKRECLNNGCQSCGLKRIRDGILSFADESQRLEAWIYIVENHANFKHLKKKK